MPILNDPSARFQVRSRGELMAPGTCAVCGNGTCDDGYLDLDVFVDYLGTLYLCLTCLTEAGETIGMYTAEQVKTTEALMSSMAKVNEDLTQELKHARPVIDSLRAIAAANGTPDVPSGTADSEPAVVEQSTDKTPSGPDAGESKPAEPVKVPGRTKSSGIAARDVKF